MLESDDPPTAVYVKALETIVPPLERYGYDLVEKTDTITLDLTERQGAGTVVLAGGTAKPAVRRAFAELSV